MFQSMIFNWQNNGYLHSKHVDIDSTLRTNNACVKLKKFAFMFYIYRYLI